MTGDKLIIMQFPYIHICAILNNDRVNDQAVKNLIAKEAWERDVADSGGLREASAFKRIRQFTGLGIRVNDLNWFSDKNAIGEHDGRF